MIKIGVTGLLSSGKTTVSKILSKKKYPIFSADKEVKKLYTNLSFIKKIKKNFKLEKNKTIKSQIKSKVLKNDKNLKKLEMLIHPLIRNKMKNFIKLKKNNKILILEIPLLIESKLMKYFDVIFFVAAHKKNRINRYLNSGGNKKIFNLLDKRQMKSSVKVKSCDHVIHNNRSFKMLKKNAKNLLKRYE